MPRDAAVRARDRVWHRVLAALWERRRVVLLERDLAEPITVHEAEVPVSFVWAEPETLDALVDPSLGFNEKTLRVARSWLEAGDRCLIGYVGGAPATYRWIAFRTRRLPGSRLVIGGRQAYFYKSFTVAALRGRGLNQAALAVALAHCQAMGMTRVFSDVEVANTASLKSLRNAGFRDVGTFSILRVRGWRRAFVPRRLHRRVRGAL